MYKKGIHKYGSCYCDDCFCEIKAGTECFIEDDTSICKDCYDEREEDRFNDQKYDQNQRVD